MIERCGDRQLKHDALKKWPFHLFIESLPVMLQIALLLLACGLCQHMVSVNTSVAIVLTTFTALGVLFYLGIIIAGTVSYECPFQTPASTTLCGLWKKVGPQISTTLLPVMVASASFFKHLPWSLVLATMHHMWEVILCQVLHMLLWLPQVGRYHHSQSSSLPIGQANPQEPTSYMAHLLRLWEKFNAKYFQQSPPLPTIQEDSPNVIATSPWLTPTALATLQKSNIYDALCLSWVLWNITDPEALDAAIRLAGTIQWFEDGLSAEPPYDLIISSLKMCFDSTGKLYPGSRDRAYSSAQATLWIHICAMCVSEELALRFPLPVINCNIVPIAEEDLPDLLRICTEDHDILAWMFDTLPPRFTPAYSQWTSNALLHLSWAKKGVPGAFSSIGHYRNPHHRNTIPVNILLNHLLVSCIILDWPIDKVVLRVQNKLYVILFSFSPNYSH